MIQLKEISTGIQPFFLGLKYTPNLSTKVLLYQKSTFLLIEKWLSSWHVVYASCTEETPGKMTLVNKDFYVSYIPELFKHSVLAQLSFKTIVPYCKMSFNNHETHNFKKLKYDLQPYNFIKELVAGHQLWKNLCVSNYNT